jgi:peptide/nickel transport system substrate-binding protein
MLRSALLATAILAAAPGAALAQRTLTVGMAGIPTGMDPHYHSSNNNNAQLRQIFNPLIDLDTQSRIFPVLAESWRNVDDLTWEFRLREGVRFHDGTPFEAEDVVFSFTRVPQVPNSPGPFTPMVRTVAEVQIVDARTIRFVTREPTPFFDRDITAIMMLSRRIHANAQLGDFNQGRMLIGTGAYRHVSYAQGERHELVRNPDFWGPRPPWDRVITRYMTNNGARVAALLAGDVDLIDAVPVQDLQRLSNDPRLAVFTADSITTSYLMPDTVRDQAPFITDKQGNPLPRNPLRDLRVRQAISLSIPREAIVTRLLVGQGRAAEQFAAPSLPDRAQGLPPIPTDLVRARALMAEAGYPDGFRMTIHGPNGFIPSDADILQAIAQGLTRIGIETRVEVLPPANFFTRATAREFAMFMTTFTTSTAANMLRQVVTTRNPVTGVGPFNRQHYSNPAVDEPLLEALRTMNPERRNALTAQAMRVATTDLGVIPVHYLRVSWAAQRTRVRYDASPIWYTNALLASPAE